MAGGHSETGVDRRRADIALVCALPLELAPFVRQLDRRRTYTGGSFVFRGGFYEDCRVVVVESGPGSDRAARATESLIDAHQPRWIVSTGLAGALRPDIKLGDIVVADAVISTEGHEILTPCGMQSNPAGRLHVGRFATASSVVTKVTDKVQLGQQTGALSVDLETYGVASVCKERKVRFLAVRAISDDLSEDLPTEVTALMGPTGATRWGAAIGSLLQRPGSLTRLLKLRGHATSAAQNLTRFLDGVVLQLHDTLDD